jgi:hypothetical protein
MCCNASGSCLSKIKGAVIYPAILAEKFPGKFVVIIPEIDAEIPEANEWQYL